MIEQNETKSTTKENDMGQRITLFCGEFNGGLIAAHMSLRANEVRANIAVMTSPGYPVKIGWAKALKDGWRVVPVQVAKLHKR